LLEADPNGSRAGAIDLMPDLDPNLRVLLRGLLTTAKDARWTGDNVDRWIRGLPVKEHYDSARKDTHLRWRGRPYTVPEMATLLQSAECWAENAVQLFEPATRGTLAYFLRWSTTQSDAQAPLTTALELADSLSLKLATPSARREVVTMVALLQLSGGRLIWRGREIDGAVVPVMIAELGEAEALMVLRGLIARSTAVQIERVDSAAGRWLAEFGRTINDVESILKRNAWLNLAETADAVRIFRLALDSVPALRAIRDTLAENFAGSDQPAMEKLFKAQNVGRAELIVLTWASTAPEKFKFYTHAEAARRRAEALRTRGVELIATLTWVQLERALQTGRLILGGWGTFIATWFGLGCVAFLLWPGFLGLALMPLPGLVALLFRILNAPKQRGALHALVPDVQWTWRDGPKRCRRELQVAGRGVRCEVLEAELANVERELAALSHVQPPPVPLPALPHFPAVRIAGASSWVLLVVFAGIAGWRLVDHPISAKALKTAWSQTKEPAPETKTPVASEAVGTKTDKAGDVKISWPYKPGVELATLNVRVAQPANSEQIAYATRHGRDLVAPYRVDTINAPIVLPVPAGEDIGVMIFDGKHGELVNQQVYLLTYRPMARTWVELSNRRGVYLDQ
jgi:hypothetical protein